MKRVFLTLVLFVLVASGNAFATTPEYVTRQAREAFKKEFPSARGEKWEVVGDNELYLVRFVYDDRGHVAYVEPEGTVVASARIIENINLPFKVNEAIKAKFKNADIRKIEELTMGDGLSYLFTIEQNGSRMVLRIHTDGRIQKIGKEKSYPKGF